MKFVIVTILCILSTTTYADCKKLQAESLNCPENSDLIICEHPDIQRGISISSSEAEFLVEFKSTFCGVSRVADQIYCEHKETYPGHSINSTGDLLKAVLIPRDPNPVPTWDLSGTFRLRLGNGKWCNYKVQ